MVRLSVQPKTKMKTMKIAQILLVIAALGLAVPARADTMSVPSAASPAYSFEVPSGWKPVGNAEDEVVEATSPDGHAYLMAWIVKTSDEKSLTKDLGGSATTDQFGDAVIANMG